MGNISESNRKNYQKKYREDHKDQNSVYQKNYYILNREHILDYHRDYNEIHKESNSKYQKNFYDAHKEHILEHKKQYYNQHKAKILKKQKDAREKKRRLKMQKIDRKFVDKLNDEVSSENFEDIVDKYALDTPEKYSHELLCEQDGIEVWGESVDGELLVYDAYNGFYLLSLYDWMQEIKGAYDEEAKEIFKDLGIREILPLNEFKVKGYECRKFTVRSGSKSSARINVPLEWMNKEVMVITLE